MDKPNTPRIEIDLHNPGDWTAILSDLALGLDAITNLAAALPDDDALPGIQNCDIRDALQSAAGHLATAVLRFLTITTVPQP